MEEVREWPVNVFGILRVLIHVAIPVGSWIASALVERLVTGALDGDTFGLTVTTP